MTDDTTGPGDRVFQGEVLSVEEMLRRAEADPGVPSRRDVGVVHTAAGNAADAAELLAASEPLAAGWRFGILQTLDDYTSTLRRGGPSRAAAVFAEPPAPTGAAELDAGFAALADHLAERDGWDTPAWALDPARTAAGWYPAVPEILRKEAERDSPRAFRQRGIYITTRSLNRA